MIENILPIGMIIKQLVTRLNTAFASIIRGRISWYGRWRSVNGVLQQLKNPLRNAS
jgi:hypothetical protein